MVLIVAMEHEDNIPNTLNDKNIKLHPKKKMKNISIFI